MFKLSLIIPVFNVEKYLPQCLDSVLDQDSDYLEVIIIDDCSTDESFLVIKKYENKFQNLKVFRHEYNMGLGSARNTGLRNATGDYIAMLDSDDWLCKGVLKQVLKKLSNCNENIDLLQMGCNKVGNNSEVLQEDIYFLYDVEPSDLMGIKLKVLNLPCYAWLKIIRREYLLKLEMEFKKIIYEDIPWSINVVAHANNIVCLPIAFCNYRQRKGSILNTVSDRHIEMITAYELSISDLRKNNIDKKILLAVFNSFIESSYYLFLQKSDRLSSSSSVNLSRIFWRAVKASKVYPASLRAVAMLAFILFWTIWD